MLEQFKQHIQNHFLQLKEQKVLVACSGGVDSVVLLYLLNQCDLEVGVAHCNFSLRKLESDEDAAFVATLASQLKVPFFTKTFETKKFAKTHSLSTQVAARELRYTWFQEIASKHHYQSIATGHHADDDLETFFINLSRGTGIRGLTGIPETNENIIRPLLPFSRAKILAFAKKEQLFWREDSSNKKTDYLRNKLRLEVIPQFKEVNKTVLENFKTTQNNLQKTKKLLDDYLVLIAKLVLKQTSDGYTIDIENVQALPNYTSLLYELLLPFGFTDFIAIEKLLLAQTGKKVVSKSHQVLKDRNRLLITRIEEDHDQKEFFIKKNQQNFKAPIKLVFTPTSKVGNIDATTVYVDASLLVYPLKVRKWLEGDVFRPFGMKGKKKLSKFFKDEKLSLVAKQKTWLLLSEDKIVWVIGHRPDDRFKITETTKAILKIELKEYL